MKRTRSRRLRRLEEDGAALVVEGFRRGEETAHAAAEVGGAGEVGLGGGVGSAQGEDARRGGDGAEDLVGVFRLKLYAVLEDEGYAHRQNCSLGGGGATYTACMIAYAHVPRLEERLERRTSRWPLPRLAR